jgi:enterochelin esterase family protein
VISPEIDAERVVTFRLLAPDAKEVVTRVLVNSQQLKLPMTKDEKGVWSVKTGPLEPGVTDYNFILDGVSIIDPRNPLKKQGAQGAGTSQLIIAAEPPAVWEMRKVPHGAVHVHYYESPAWDIARRFHVYTPPGYETGRSRYPLLVLLHGAGDTDREWTETGKANLILDNLIAEGKARPMIIVMPDGHAPRTGAGRVSDLERQRQGVLFERDLTLGVIPEVERLYRVDKVREQRAIAGLSMGGAQALNIGLARQDLFSYIGVFSMGLSGPRGERDFLDAHEKELASPEELNRKLKLFWIGCGEKDFLWGAAQKLDEVLTKVEVRHTFRKTGGGHEWNNWVRYLAEIAPLLFR